ncbi:MAG: hypothetical protein ACFBSE_15275 [Prochloraceae cyanobacterium]
MNDYKQPLYSFVLTVGSVEAAIGSLNRSYSLFAFGLITIFLAGVISWWQKRSRQTNSRQKLAKRFLSPAPDREPLPKLTRKKQSRM